MKLMLIVKIQNGKSNLKYLFSKINYLFSQNLALMLIWLTFEFM